MSMKPYALRSRFTSLSQNRSVRSTLAAVVALAAALGYLTIKSAAEPKDPTEEYGEWLPAPEEIPPVGGHPIPPSTRIPRSPRLNGQAMRLGKTVYEEHCAACHGPDLKGLADQHTPDLTDDVWRFSGDDLPSGGLRNFPSDAEWTIRYGIRSGHPNARGAEVNMLAFYPEYRTKEDTEDFGDKKFLTDAEIEDVIEYVM